MCLIVRNNPLYGMSYYDWVDSAGSVLLNIDSLTSNLDMSFRLAL